MVNALAAIGIPAALLAHQGGWDEMLLVAGPIAIVVGLLALARRRVTRTGASARPVPEPEDARERHGPSSIDGSAR
jgi:hypothetical protein